MSHGLEKPRMQQPRLGWVAMRWMALCPPTQALGSTVSNSCLRTAFTMWFRAKATWWLTSSRLLLTQCGASEEKRGKENPTLVLQVLQLTYE